MAINKQFLVLYPSWIQRIQEGFRLNLIFFGTVLVPSPYTPVLETSDSSYLSISPTPRNNSGAGILSQSSLGNESLDGSSAVSFEGEEFIYGIAFMNSSASTDAINWVLDLLTGVQGPGTYKPSALGLWSELFISTVALICGLHLGVFLMVQGDGVGHHLPLLLIVYGSWMLVAPFCTLEQMGSLAGSLLDAVLSSFCSVSGSPYVDWVAGVDDSLRDMLSGPAVFWWCEHCVGMLTLVEDHLVGSAHNMNCWCYIAALFVYSGGWLVDIVLDMLRAAISCAYGYWFALAEILLMLRWVASLLMMKSPHCLFFCSINLCLERFVSLLLQYAAWFSLQRSSFALCSWLLELCWLLLGYLRVCSSGFLQQKSFVRALGAGRVLLHAACDIILDSRLVDEVGLLAATILLFLARRLLVHEVSRQMRLRLIAWSVGDAALRMISHDCLDPFGCQSAGLEGDLIRLATPLMLPGLEGVLLLVDPSRCSHCMIVCLPCGFDACSREPVRFDSRLIQGVCSLSFSI
ncbi:hypothetical protein POTOM_040853 [Populus tomentosa]|uniref:Uncharacterized protein n=1 Tax=Populus tomentosa TaxID=118781 RepID=A0A8X7YPS6_POPTO|nr:hypothetical protein POTOM_040853 [Populus tomentosa]